MEDQNPDPHQSERADPDPYHRIRNIQMLPQPVHILIYVQKIGRNRVAILTNFYNFGQNDI